MRDRDRLRMSKRSSARFPSGRRSTLSVPPLFAARRAVDEGRKIMVLAPEGRICGYGVTCLQELLNFLRIRAGKDSNETTDDPKQILSAPSRNNRLAKSGGTKLQD